MKTEVVTSQAEMVKVHHQPIILVAASHDGVRRGICALLRQQLPLSLVAEAASDKTAIQRAITLQPEAMVIDVGMQGTSCADLCTQILHHMPGLRIIVVSSFAEDERLTAALHAGAAGYVLKRISSTELARMLVPQLQ